LLCPAWRRHARHTGKAQVRARVEVSDKQVRVFVNEAKMSCLVVERLTTGKAWPATARVAPVRQDFGISRR